jgi:hypothetical protein
MSKPNLSRGKPRGISHLPVDPHGMFEVPQALGETADRDKGLSYAQLQVSTVQLRNLDPGALSFLISVNRLRVQVHRHIGITQILKNSGQFNRFVVVLLT